MSITFVKSARARKDGKAPFRCVTCTQQIEPGQAYAWSQASRFAARISWHQACTAPRPSVLEGNDKTATVMAAFEEADDAFGAIDLSGDTWTDELLREEIEGILSGLSQGIQDAADMYHEAASNIEDGFGHATEQSEAAEENASFYEDLAGSTEQTTDSIDMTFPTDGEWDSWAEWAEDVVQQVRDEVTALEEHP